MVGVHAEPRRMIWCVFTQTFLNIKNKDAYASLAESTAIMVVVGMGAAIWSGFPMKVWGRYNN